MMIATTNNKIAAVIKIFLRFGSFKLQTSTMHTTTAATYAMTRKTIDISMWVTPRSAKNSPIAHVDSQNANAATESGITTRMSLRTSLLRDLVQRNHVLGFWREYLGLLTFAVTLAFFAQFPL